MSEKKVSKEPHIFHEHFLGVRSSPFLILDPEIEYNDVELLHVFRCPLFILDKSFIVTEIDYLLLLLLLLEKSHCRYDALGQSFSKFHKTGWMVFFFLLGEREHEYVCVREDVCEPTTTSRRRIVDGCFFWLGITLKNDEEKKKTK